MKAELRRNEILKYLQLQDEPVSASTLASHFSVSRQIIVGDIALLRAAGENISATPRGYLFEDKGDAGAIIREVACIHSAADMEKELQICVDNGCSVLDVSVEHPIYGQLTGQLCLSSRYDISQFMELCKSEQAHALSELTDGLHLHRLKCPSQDAYDRVCRELRKAKILYK